MVSTLLDEGAGDLKSQDFQRRLEDLSVRLHFSAGRDNFSGRLRTLTRNRDEAFGLLKLAITKPRFDSDAVARMRSQIMAGLRQGLEDPGAIAARRLFKTLFPDHPYGRPTDGTLATVRAITIDDLRAFAREPLRQKQSGDRRHRRHHGQGIGAASRFHLRRAARQIPAVAAFRM